MDLKSFVQLLRKSWWIVLAGIVVGLLGGGASVLVTTPQYRAAVTFFVSTSSAVQGNVVQLDEYAVRRISSYAELLTEDVMLDRILADTQLPMSRSALRGTLSATTGTNTVLLTAAVVDSDPERTIAITTSVAESFAAVVAEVDHSGPAGSTGVTLSIVSGPSATAEKVAPRPVLNLALGLIGGLGVGIGAAYLRGILDTRIREARDLRERFGLSVLGEIPVDADARRNPVLMPGGFTSIRAEALRTVRTKLRFLDATRRLQVMVVTSAVAGDGKTSTALALAQLAAESGQRTVLVDADLRRPMTATYLGLEGVVGLSTVLAGQISVEEALQPWGESGLQVLCSGECPPNPGELLSSDAMPRLVEQLRRDHDLVIIDTPPLRPVSDAAQLSSLADGTLLVLRQGLSTRHDVAETLEKLKAVDARLVGVVFSMVRGNGTQPSYTTAGTTSRAARRRAIERD